MIVAGIDVETTGLNTSEDRIIEIGAVVWDTEAKVPLDMISSFVQPPLEKLPLLPEIVKLTGIREEWLRKWGIPVSHALMSISNMMESYGAKYVLAHNGENFDRPIVMAEIERSNIEDSLLKDLPWLDTRSDLPFEEEPGSRRLNHLALDQGFINPFQHRAVFDVLTMLKVASKYDFEEIVAHSRIPWCTMRALVDYDNRDKAKELRYSWEQIGDKKYPKCWVKRVRENLVESEALAAAAKGFKAVKIE